MAAKKVIHTLLSALVFGALLVVMTGCGGDTRDIGTAMVEWTPPTQYSDGSAATDLAGHRVYYGTDPNALTRVINVEGTAYTSQFIDNLAPGTWYFAVTAYNGNGLESRRSSIHRKTIQ